MSLSNPATIDATESTDVAVVESTEVATTETGFQAPTSFKGAEHFFKKMDFEIERDMTEPCTIIGGKIKVGENLKEEAGDYIDLQLLNYEPYWKVNLGKGQPTDAEKKLQLISADGKTVTLEDGTSKDVSAYMQELRETGYDNVKLEERCALHGFYLGAEKPEKNSLVAVGEGDMPTLLTVYLSPTSFKEFKKFVSKLSLYSINKGTKVRLGTEDKEWKEKGVTWTVFSFTAQPQ